MASSRTSAALSAASWSSSMAPSTACSASLLHGIWRPARSAWRSVDETAGDADVIPGGLLPVGVAEQGGRMVRDDDRDPPQAMDLIAQRAERLLRVEERLRRRAAHRQDHGRLHQLDLTQQIREAGGDLVILGDAVLGWAAFDHVTNEYPLARQLDRREDLGEQLAGGAHERPARLVFHAPRALPHHDQARAVRAFARDGVPAPLAQPALGARRHELRDGGERG